jgi:predicted enzyme related to lactoylglutathione lyase
MSTGVTTATGRFVWHEHVSDDPKQAQAFYTQLFGWQVETWKSGEIEYPMINANGANHGGFGNRMEGAPPTHWLGHVAVTSVDETIEKVQAAGGQIVFGPIDMKEVGRFAIIVDPQGSFVSAFQPEGEGPAQGGVFVWDELGSQDVDGAERFYGAVFGWATKDMGAEYGGYRIFGSGETQIGGLMKMPDPSLPSQWVPYVYADDIDATAARAKELGASVVVEPMDVPSVGRIAVVVDPQGATFGLFKPSAS